MSEFTLIPAVDIKNGKCVRLVHGDARQETIYSEDPVDMAKKWADMGAERLHVVDLDGAFDKGDNVDIILQIRKSISCPIQMGGGLRGLKKVQRLMDAGIDRLVLGTAIFKTPHWVQQAVETYPGKLIAGVDAKNREVKVEGWTEGSGWLLNDVLKKIADIGFQEVIFTDIARDGALQGPNIEAIKGVLNITSMGVYASGGVSQLADLSSLKSLAEKGLRGCIVGKSLYDGRVDFKEALAICSNPAC